jgi:cell division protein FtsB
LQTLKERLGIAQNKTTSRGDADESSLQKENDDLRSEIERLEEEVRNLETRIG